MKLKGKHVFITGSGKRLGRALAEKLLALGVNLSAHYHQSEALIKDLQSQAQKRSLGKVIPIHADLTDFNSIEKAVIQSQEQLGPVDILINSASDFFSSPLLETTPELWDRLFDLNLKAPFFISQRIAETMARGSHILFVADVHGSRPIKNYGPYCATKAGLISLTKSLAKELAPAIRVNSISPGTLLLAENSSEVDVQKAAARSLLGRVGNPQDFVQAVLFLLHNEYVTGFDLIVDGGRALL